MTTTEAFGTTYAGSYNLLYTEKNYLAECDLLEQIFRRYAKGPVQSVVDFGCGTGNHAFPVARRGYDVVGVERSEGMLGQARQRLSDEHDPVRLRFQQGDIRNVQLGRTFDAALMMFAVLGYQVANGDATAALQTARRHLDTGGLFICDFWYGPAVLHQRPAERLKVIPIDRGRLLRAASGDLDIIRQTCDVRYRLWQLQDDRLTAEADETHVMRFFFPRELALLLEWAGFSLLRLGSFPDFDREPDEMTWNVMAVARAV